MRSNQFVVVGCTILLLVCTGLAEPAKTSGASLLRPHRGQDPERVEFFIYLLDVDDINGQDQNFTVNFHLALRWKDERLAHEGPNAKFFPREDVWNPTVMLANRQALLRMPLPEVVQVEPDGTATYRQQYVGPLSQPLFLTDFPFDKQSFSIHFLSTGIQLDEIEFVPRTVPEMGLTGGGMAKKFSLPDWDVITYKAEARPLKIEGVAKVPGFAFEFVAKRYASYYTWQVILPFVLIVMMSWAPFWIDPVKAGLQLGMASSTVLTLIAYRFYLVNLVPRLPYLTRLDYLMLYGTILVFLAFWEVLMTSVLSYGNRAAAGRLMDRVNRVAFPVIFAVLLVWSLFL